LVLARAARDEMGLDRVLFIPAGQPWRKADRDVTSADQRLAMLRLALEREETFEIVLLEIEREGPSYAADTLEALRRDWPNDELFFILGEDALLDMPNWARPARILELAILVVARRVSVDREAVQAAVDRLPGLLQRTVWLKMPLLDISGTEVRDRASRCLPIGDLVPLAVETYIGEHALYRA
jgi:nicotinate-nucleotide adenylyltransferase